MTKKITTSIVTLILITFLACELGNQNQDMLGIWSKTVPINYTIGTNRHLSTISYIYEFDKNGSGRHVHRDIKSVNDKSEYAYSIEYKINWEISKDSIYNLITIKYLNGEITDLSGNDKLVVEQQAIQSKDRTMNDPLKMWFKRNDNGEIIWSYYRDNFDEEAFTMNYEEK